VRETKRDLCRFLHDESDELKGVCSFKLTPNAIAMTALSTLPSSRVELLTWASAPASTVDLAVVVVGFLGSTRKSMTRFGNIFNEILKRRCGSALNFRVYCVLPPVSLVFYAGITADPRTNGYGALLSDVEDLVGSSKKVIFQFCSNGGAFLFEAMVRLSTVLLSSKTVGMVFDSAPVDITSTAISNAASGALGRVGGGLAVLAYGLFQGERDLEKRREDFASLFSGGSYQEIPRLYLYSSTDRISNPQLIERVVDPRRDSAYNFRITSHCSHLRLFQKIYSDQIEIFLDRLGIYGDAPRSRL